MADKTDDKGSAAAPEETKVEETPAVPAEVPVTEKSASETENKPVEESEAKETDKMLEKSEDDKKEEKVDEGKEKTGDEIIDIPAEEADKKKKVKAEEREVKPRKIPIGGIKMPGFFTKKNPKKDKAGDGAEDELLKKEEEKEPEPKPEEEKKEPVAPSPGFFSNFKIWNPFAKKPAAPVDPEAPPAEEAPKPEEEKKEEGTGKFKKSVQIRILISLIFFYSQPNQK